MFLSLLLFVRHPKNLIMFSLRDLVLHTGLHSSDSQVVATTFRTFMKQFFTYELSAAQRNMLLQTPCVSIYGHGEFEDRLTIYSEISGNLKGEEMFMAWPIPTDGVNPKDILKFHSDSELVVLDWKRGDLDLLREEVGLNKAEMRVLFANSNFREEFLVYSVGELSLMMNLKSEKLARLHLFNNRRVKFTRPEPDTGFWSRKKDRESTLSIGISK